jgi:hypothetical protein
MPFAIYIFSVLVFVLLAGAIPMEGEAQTAVFRSPAFIALGGVFCLACASCVGRGGRWKRPGFVLCHLAVVLICAGAFVGYRYGERTSFRAPVMDGEPVKELPKPDGSSLPLGFGIVIPAAAADHYDVKSYGMYEPPEYNLVGDVEILQDGTLDLPAELQPAPSALRDADGNYARQIVLRDGNLLQLIPPAVKHYEATIRFVHDDAPSDTRVASVNHPISYRGWRFYLMDYSEDPYLNVSFSARRDPGRILVIVGIWLLIAGTAWLCWLPRRCGA